MFVEYFPHCHCGGIVHLVCGLVHLIGCLL